MQFLDGETDLVLKQLQEQMVRAAENLQFELAALYRDRLQAAQRIAEQQKITSTAQEDADYVALAQDPRTGDTAVQVFLVRHGRLIGRDSFLLEGADVVNGDRKRRARCSQADAARRYQPMSTVSASPRGTVVGAFLQQFYDNATFIPGLVLVDAMPGDRALLETWLADRRGQKVEIRVPKRGDKLKLMALAQENAAEYLRLQQAERAADAHRQTEAVAELQAVLHLEQPPTRIECYDISTLQGTNTVGAMVVFVKGAPAKQFYKRFKIQGKGGQGAPDDFAAMREMLRRRFRRLVEPDADADDPGKKGRGQQETWRIAPDLVIVDGGKGQLGVAVEVLDRVGADGSESRSWAWQNAKRNCFALMRRTRSGCGGGASRLHLVQRVRDEAHRFGITYHRNLRSKEQVRSRLDDIPGVGPRRRKAILAHFGGDLDRVRQATLEELLAVPGVTRKVALTIKEAL